MRFWNPGSLMVAAICLCSAWVGATEQHAPMTRWQKIDLPDYRIVFEPELRSEAERIASYLEFYVPKMEQSMPVSLRPKRIPILLSSSSHESNGYVAVSPFRSVFFNQPAAFAAEDWLKTLSIHEVRHTIQALQPLDTNSGRILTTWFGESGSAFLNVLFYPAWFLEGDAVLEETLLSNGGRGRVASFDLWRRTHELSQPRYDYFRAFLGTGYDSYPFANHYELGYFLTTYLRNTYGDRILDDILESTGEFGLTITFDGNTRKLTKDSLPETYEHAMNELHQRWKAQQQAMTLTDIDPLWAPGRKAWRSYYPFASSGDTTWAIRHGVMDGTWLVGIENGREVRIRQIRNTVASSLRGTAKQRSISKGDDQVCWINYHADARFNLQSWGDIDCYSLQQDRLQHLTQRQKYTSVAVSPTDRYYAAAEFTETRDASIRILDASGVVVQHFALPKHAFAFDLAWSADEQQLVFVQLDDEGFSIRQLQLASGQQRILMAANHDQVPRSPVFTDQGVVYSSDYSGTDQLWLLPDTGQPQLIVQRPYGAYFPNWNATLKSIVFADYQSHGQDIVTVPLANLSGIEKDQVLPVRTDYFAPLQAQRSDNPLLADITPPEPQDHDVSAYSRWGNLVNINNWSLLFSGQSASATVNSNNLLNTVGMSASAVQDFKHHETSGSFSLAYRRWYPVITASVASDFHVQTDKQDVERQWRQNTRNVGAYVPWSWQQDYQQLQAVAGVNLSFSDIDGIPVRDDIDNQPSGELVLWKSYVGFSQQREGAQRDFESRHGWVAELGFNQSVDEWSDFDKQQYWGSVKLYFPGFWLTHSIVAEAEYEEQQGDDDFLLPNQFEPARGFLDTLTKDQGGRVGLEYVAPVGSLSWRLGRVLYLKSWQLSMSADYETAEYQDEFEDRWSTGVKVALPSHLFSNLSLQVNPYVSTYLVDGYKMQTIVGVGVSNE
ncbi:TolB family protein [Gynuella sunshinyii]|uniref:Periplasmic component of the Tol biopolymer transport system n=1 Tax=Gynuella sunshinyii YC6258 TaxID=1445510 RepID=A0A0C5V032_9GAMM|nr:hypothetical protein [Gynuella sunshinyii]AJQ92930.1 periplasmic component of the Tol biopolymer transport system [Gynuella sunshinyii YC6258]